MFALWVLLSGFLAVRHVVWRDEMRALSLALTGDSVFGMLRAVHGEGHPALWYLMLRGAHAIVPVREVLPVIGWSVAAAAAALVAWRAPFRPVMLALILFSAFFTFEYAATARNYGISMLVLFALAEAYPRRRDSGIRVGLLLALLCNTNVPSAFLAAGLLLFWLIEITSEEGIRWTPSHRRLFVNGLIAAGGALLAFLEVYPTVHDAAVTQHPGGVTAWTVLRALATPAYSFWDTMPPMIPPSTAAGAAMGIIMFGCVLSLVRAPAAFVTALLLLLTFELFFRLVYPGSYRHQALFLVYLVTLNWLVARGCGGRWPERWRGLDNGRIARLGFGFLSVLLALQLLTTSALLASELHHYPYSRSRDLAALLRREHLERAVVIGDPEMFLEALPYYAGNPIYLMREQRFGSVVRFTRFARRDLHLDDFLRDARLLRARTGRPVVIVLQHRLDPGGPPFHIAEGYVWTFTAERDEQARFFAATRRLARFDLAATDESYDVYILS